MKGYNVFDDSGLLDPDAVVGPPLPSTKRLRITYGGNDLYDGDVVSVNYGEEDGTVTITGRTKVKPSTNWVELLKGKARDTQPVKGGD